MKSRLARSAPLAGIALLVLLQDAAPARAGGPRLLRFDPPVHGDAVGPRLVAGRGGTVLLSWTESRPGGGHRLRFANLEGRQWSAPRTIAEGDSFFVNWADFPAICVLDSGTLAAAWLWRSGAGTYAYDVRAGFSADGGQTWSRPIVVHRDGTATEHGFLSLVPEGEGVRVVWLDGRKMDHLEEGAPGAEMTVRTAVVSPAGVIADEHEIDARACDCCATAAAGTTDGTIIAYRDRGADERRDIALARRAAGGWSAPAMPRTDGWIIPGCPVNGPALDARGNGVALAWYTAARETASVFVALSADGGQTFAPAARVDQGRPLGRVDVARRPGGGAVVSWLESTEKDARVLHREIRPDGSPGDIVTVTRTSAKRASGFPQVLLVGSRVIAAWTEAGKHPRIHVAGYDLAAGNR